MSPNAKNSPSELDRFRRQWQEEVNRRTGRTATASSGRGTANPAQVPPQTVPLKALSIHETAPRPEDETGGQLDFDGLDFEGGGVRLGQGSSDARPFSQQIEPKTALEHYERAVEKEGQGKLGDSLSHYRKAFRLDDHVDNLYKNKHFPPTATSSKPTNVNPSSAPVTVPNPAHHSLHGQQETSLSQLVASFAAESIQGLLPPTEASPVPPCPISSIPPEVLVHVLTELALLDPAAFVRLSLVCKRFAYLVITEEQIWKQVCHHDGFGFASMLHDFRTNVEGKELRPTIIDAVEHDLAGVSLSSTARFTIPLVPKYPSYLSTYRSRPRIRFNGLYISTVNYTRPGASNATMAAWNTPVHIVTYYRYLRFFHDGTCISLLHTAEPAEVVPWFSKDYLDTTALGLPSAVMRHVLPGRWRIGRYDGSDNEAGRGGEGSDEGNVYVETMGVDDKYTYHMQLVLRSGSNKSNSTKNNKLVWKSYWSYNKLTDDWGEFGLRNDRAFVWSRVRRWGP